MCDRFPRKFDVQTSYKPSNVIFVVNNKSPRATYHTIAPSTEELYCFKSDKHPISPYNITVWSSIQVMRIKELITNIKCLDVCANSPKLKFEIEKPETTLASHCHYSISKSPSPKTAEAPSSFTKKQPRNHYSYTTNQPYPRIQRSTSFAMSGNVSKIDAPHKRHP